MKHFSDLSDLNSESEHYTQITRSVKDGTIGVTRSPDGFVITCCHDGVEQTMRIGSFNALRLFAMLSQMLGIKLAAKYAKAIKL